MPSVVVTPARGSQEQHELNYTHVTVIGNGSFGIVHLVRLSGCGEFVAIKKVHQDKRYKHRELSIMRALEHKNIVDIKYFFYSVGVEEAELFLNLILEYVPETVHHVERHYSRLRQPIPLIYIKLYAFQLLRALSYMHGRGVCHRDIKPENLLVDPSSSVLKLCDFGSAKYVMKGESNLSYICSRYYRAPELLFGSVNYTFSVDVWSAGTVLAELFLGRPVFSGMSALDQLIEVIKVLGTPSMQQVRDMNPNYQQRNLPNVAMVPWSSVLPPGTCSEALDLVSKLLTYSPNSRLSPLEGCAHILFDCLRRPSCTLPNGRAIPCCTDFTALEMASMPHLTPILSPQSVPPEMNSPVSASEVSLLSECTVDGLGTEVASAGDSLTTHQVA